MSSLTEVSLEDFLDLYKEDILAHWDISEWNDFETSSKLTITCMVDFNRRRLGTMSRDMLPAYKKYGKKRREKTRDKYFYDNPFNRIHGFIILEDMTDKKNIPKDKKVLCISYVCSSIYSNHKGVGKILIEYAKKYATEMKYTDIILEVANDIAGEAEVEEEVEEEEVEEEEEYLEEEDDEDETIQELTNLITHEFWRKTMRHRKNEEGTKPFHNVDQTYIQVNIDTYFMMYEDSEESYECFAKKGNDDNHYGGKWYAKGKKSMKRLQTYYEKLGFIENHNINTDWHCFSEIPFPSMILTL